jgi:hypothetical protein
MLGFKHPRRDFLDTELIGLSYNQTLMPRNRHVPIHNSVYHRKSRQSATNRERRLLRALRRTARPMVRIDLVPKPPIVLLRASRTTPNLPVKSIHTLLVRHDQAVRAAAVLEADLPVDVVERLVADVHLPGAAAGVRGIAALESLAGDDAAGRVDVVFDFFGRVDAGRVEGSVHVLETVSADVAADCVG